jgi:hypothetical protein
VSESDYLSVLNSVSGASTYGPVTYNQFTGSTASEFSSPWVISDSTQSGLEGGSYILGFAVRGSRTGSQGSYTVGVQQTTGTVSGGTYTAVTSNVSFTNTVAGSKTYFIRKSPQTNMSVTSYLAIYFSMNLSQLNLSARPLYYDNNGTPPFTTGNFSPVAFISMVSPYKTW